MATIRSARLARLYQLITILALATAASAGDANRLTYLDVVDPYYVSRDFPKLVTPQWVGEEGVEAVVILAIDDMREHKQWEQYLRPILERLKQIDGRAPASIMTCQIKPDEPHLQRWLAEGVSLETHTFDHPCPLLAGGDLAKARATYEKCVDLMARVPNSRPVAFRTPCCDSLNTVSPRFFAEIFNRTTSAGNFLAIDSSVFQAFTPNDPELPRDLVLLPDGTERFRRYWPADRGFVNVIEDYPYPYVLGGLCWEFPCMTPSDWEAQNIQRPANPRTVEDWKAAFDATVVKQGTFSMVFHPYEWIRPEQVVELIDHAQRKHGPKVKFLSFREALDRLEKNLLAGATLRAADGGDNGVRLIDLDGDGYLDVVVGNDSLRRTRIWSPAERKWSETEFPVSLAGGEKNYRYVAGARFGIVGPDTRPAVFVADERTRGAWTFDGKVWQANDALLAGLELDGGPVQIGEGGRDRGVRLRDIDADGQCELLVANEAQNAVFAFDSAKKKWAARDTGLPEGAAIVDAQGGDAGLRFADIDDDGYDDILVSNDQRYSLDLFDPAAGSWSRRVMSGVAGDAKAPPAIARQGTNNGAWLAAGKLYVQNETTDRSPTLVASAAFNDMLAEVEPRAKSPQEALAAMRPRPGFRVELVAAEPLVASPVAFDWSADGRLWVVEMIDYPLGIDGQGKPGGRVKVLTDTDRDGVYDAAAVFLEDLPFPSGIIVYRDGVLVSAAPEIIYAADTDGDGRADKRETLFVGFHEGNQQHRVNGFRWGLDNWIYGANGDSGGTIRSTKTSDEIPLNYRDFRIQPDTGKLDPQTGATQFIRDRDDWDNWFGSQNSDPMFHFVLADHYLRRNRNLPAPDPRLDVSNAPGAAPVFPASRTLARFNDFNVANRFTSACSAMIYRDELLGPAYVGNSFVCEPVHNLVHREIVTADGVTFTSRRAPDEERSEFLASTDNWFRPVMVRTGPDGALWIADMYRAVIEHPEYIPRDLWNVVDIRGGADMGRIYRVVPVDAKPRPIPQLDKLDTAGLVAALDSPNGPLRDRIQQMLVERGDKAAVAPLKALAAKCSRDTARLHALCTLDGLGALDDEVLVGALADRASGVRRHAVRLSESRLGKSPVVATAALKLVDDADPHVRMQLAYSLGEWKSAAAAHALAQLALRDNANEYLLAAVMSSVTNEHLPTMLGDVLASLGKSADGDKSAASAEVVGQLLVLAVAYEDKGALARALHAMAPDPKRAESSPAAWSTATLGRLLEALDRRDSSLAELRDEGDPELRAAVEGLEPLFTVARATAADEGRSEEERAGALDLIGRGLGSRDQDLELLTKLLGSRNPQSLREAAVAALARLDDARVPEIYLGGWAEYGPDMRGAVLDSLLARDEWLDVLLGRLEAGSMRASDLDASRRQRLLDHRDEAIRTRATAALAAGIDANREAVVSSYRSGVSPQRDAVRGAEMFKKHCAICHRLQDVGQAVGPDLAALSNKSDEALLVAILDPNRAVETKFVSYSAETTDGLIHTGILTADSGGSVTLLAQEGKVITLPRGDLEQLFGSSKSLMPEGLEKDINPRDMSDLLAYLASTHPPRRVFEGNEPKLIEPEGFRGEFWLLASDCEIYGESLVYEPVYRNLGFWTKAADYTIWTIDVTKAGRYIVRLDYACPDEFAGNRYVLTIGDVTLSGAVESTGNWDTYRQGTVATVSLTPGQHRVVLRPEGEVKGYLLDLKSVRITPVETD